MKKAAALICVLFLAIGLAVPTFAIGNDVELNPDKNQYTQSFSDVPTNHWAFSYIANLIDRKAINGYPDGRFYPDRTVNREEFSKIMVVVAGLNQDPVYMSSFADVSTSYWASPFIEAVKPYMTSYQSSNGLVFKPTAAALREDIAIAVVMLKGYDIRLADVSLLSKMFTDADSISTAAQPYVALAVENGIISGYDDGTFRAQATITRAEAAAILWRAFQYGSDAISINQKQNLPIKSDKPFVAYTIADGVVVSEPRNFESIKKMTLDNNDNLIFYNEATSKIVSIDLSTKVETLLYDISKENYTTEDGLTVVSAVDQVFWDDVADRLLVIWTMSISDGWTSSSGKQETEHRFISILNNGELEFFRLPPLINDETYCERIESVLSDGTYVIYFRSSRGYGSYDVYSVCDLERYNYDLLRLGQTTGQRIVQKGSALYKGGDTWGGGYETFFKYNFAEDGWQIAGSLPPGVTAYQNGKFYSWYSTRICTTSLEDATMQTKLNLSDEVEILDQYPLPTKPDNLIVTTDERYIFYDSSANAIRVIEANPDAR